MTNEVAANVPDLMVALRASLEAAKQSRDGREPLPSPSSEGSSDE